MDEKKTFSVLVKDLSATTRSKKGLIYDSTEIWEVNDKLDYWKFSPSHKEDFKQKHEYGIIVEKDEGRMMVRHYILLMEDSLDLLRENIRENRVTNPPKRHSMTPMILPLNKYTFQKEKHLAKAKTKQKKVNEKERKKEEEEKIIKRHNLQSAQQASSLNSEPQDTENNVNPDNPKSKKLQVQAPVDPQTKEKNGQSVPQLTSKEDKGRKLSGEVHANAKSKDNVPSKESSFTALVNKRCSEVQAVLSNQEGCADDPQMSQCSGCGRLTKMLDMALHEGETMRLKLEELKKTHDQTIEKLNELKREKKNDIDAIKATVQELPEIIKTVQQKPCPLANFQYAVKLEKEYEDFVLPEKKIYKGREELLTKVTALLSVNAQV